VGDGADPDEGRVKSPRWRSSITQQTLAVGDRMLVLLETVKLWCNGQFGDIE